MSFVAMTNFRVRSGSFNVLGKEFDARITEAREAVYIRQGIQALFVFTSIARRLEYFRG